MSIRDDVIDEQAERIAELEADNVRLWTALNKERGRLIARRVAGGLYPAESDRLVELQALADAHIETVAPRDETVLEQAEAALDATKGGEGIDRDWVQKRQDRKRLDAQAARIEALEVKLELSTGRLAKLWRVMNSGNPVIMLTLLVDQETGTKFGCEIENYDNEQTLGIVHDGTLDDAIDAIKEADHAE